MRTPCPNPFENLLAVEVHAPKLWVASAHLNGRAAAELFPLEGGASTTVCTASGLAHHMAEKLYTLGILTLEELHDVPVRTDWRIGYVLSWVRRFGVEVNLRSIIAVMPPVTADTDALNPPWRLRQHPRSRTRPRLRLPRRANPGERTRRPGRCTRTLRTDSRRLHPPGTHRPLMRLPHR